jgi:5-methylcytosine-specific restriction enzyme A
MARTQGHGNPKWLRDETILALELYQQSEGDIPSRHDPRVIELSKVLRRLSFHREASRKKTFRNPAGVAFKLQNLRQVATGVGLGHVSAMDRAVWSDLGRDKAKVSQLAALIRRRK